MFADFFSRKHFITISYHFCTFSSNTYQNFNYPVIFEIVKCTFVYHTILISALRSSCIACSASHFILISKNLYNCLSSTYICMAHWLLLEGRRYIIMFIYVIYGIKLWTQNRSCATHLVKLYLHLKEFRNVILWFMTIFTFKFWVILNCRRK